MKTLVEIPSTPLSGSLFIAGTHVPGNGPVRQVLSPYTGATLGDVSAATKEQIDQAVSTAATAQRIWRAVPIKERTATLLTFRNLLIRDADRIAHSAAREAGKTVLEARAEVSKGIEVLEYASSLQNGDALGTLEVSRGVTCEYRREPIGVGVGITPFNFPAMVPMWMIPIAIAVGNSFILKPSDKAPFTPLILAELLAEAGLPAGVFSVVQGGVEAVEYLSSHTGIDAVAFVGSTPVARSVYMRATAAGKRALCLGGAKNHLILAPDADPAVAVEGIVSSFTGCAGQRCMAASVLVAVGDVGSIIDKVRGAAGALALGSGMGAIIDGASHERLKRAIARAAQEGAIITLDGRTVAPPAGYEGGNWLAPTILENVTSAMECAQTELFGPVLSIVRVKNLEEAIALESASPYGNATSVFTSSGSVARYVAERSSSGMIGINIGVPVPREPFSFGGTKQSRFGSGDITGDLGVEFWSTRKKITTKWALHSDRNWMS